MHFDGSPSIQKSREREHRTQVLNKSIATISMDIDQIRGTRKKAASRLYRRCKNAYRPPPSVWKEIMDELRRYGWDVHECPHQADTHVGVLCSDLSESDNVVVVTRDSDLMVYEGVWNVVMPVGRSHELTSFSKTELLSSLDLPSDRHLLVTAIVTKNDYFEGIPSIGIQRNLDVVRTLDIESGPRTDCITKAVDLYLNEIRNRGNKTLSNYRFAIDALAQCHEDSSDHAFPSSDTHNDVSDLLKRLEAHRVEGRQTQSDASQKGVKEQPKKSKRKRRRRPKKVPNKVRRKRNKKKKRTKRKYSRSK